MPGYLPVPLPYSDAITAPGGLCCALLGAQSFLLERWEKTCGDQHPWNDHV